MLKWGLGKYLAIIVLMYFDKVRVGKLISDTIILKGLVELSGFATKIQLNVSPLSNS